MNLIPVNSSDIDAIAYELKNPRTIGYKAHDHLIIKFKSGGLYAYLDVPQSKFDSLSRAESKGKFFNTEIKNKYKDFKIEDK